MNMEKSLHAFVTNSDLEPLVYADDETLIEDPRAAMRPAQRVEQKLVAALQAGPVLVSQIEMFKRPNDR